MIIHTNIDALTIKNAVVAIGFFDGVHKGHQQIIHFLIKNAKKHHGESVIITFWPHPRWIIEKEQEKVQLLNTLSEKQKLIESLGVQHLIILPFSESLANLSANAFIEEILIKKIKVKCMVIGYNNNFGKNKEGNFNSLLSKKEKWGFEIEKMDAINFNNEKISSTIIRNLLLEGEIEKTNHLLGYNYFIKGNIVSGKRIGTKIGFPTANIKPDEDYKLVPNDGVYIVSLIVNKKNYMGMLSIGTNPTFQTDNLRTIEVHIIHFNENIYDENVQLIFHKKIRNQQKFNKVEELVMQIEQDKKESLEYFKNNKI